MYVLRGDRPELHKAQVFGGITGILSEGKEEKKKQQQQQQHQGRGEEESSDEPETKRYERDFYRDNVTRRWQGEAGERDPDKVIEDIFAGGDGWARPAAPQGDHDRILDNEGRSSGEDQAYRKVSFDHALHQYESEEMIAARSWTIDGERVNRVAGTRGYTQHGGAR